MPVTCSPACNVGRWICKRAARLPKHCLQTVITSTAGISEGLLANCCGVLSESVRKQLFIVRTSGARLLALINDVMDAATLRQHRLVLKQERFELRQVVGDVMDLTRSLVSRISLLGHLATCSAATSVMQAQAALKRVPWSLISLSLSSLW